MIMRVKLTLIEEMLGTSPNCEDIYRQFIGSKSPDADTIEEEVAALGVDEVAEKGMTVFPRNADGKPFMYDYQIKGFFKDACSALNRVAKSESKKIKAYKKVIDGVIFVGEREVVIDMNGGDMGVCERPLRAQTAQGERVALASSETVPAGSTLEFDIMILEPSYLKAVTEWLDYGQLRGLGQWRNSGKGRFMWEKVS